MINAKGDLVGLVFDGNIQSLPDKAESIVNELTGALATKTAQ